MIPVKVSVRAEQNTKASLSPILAYGCSGITEVMHKEGVQSQ
jgi:hypothetical protein